MKEIYLDENEIKARINHWGDIGNPIIICLHGLGSTSTQNTQLNIGRPL